MPKRPPRSVRNNNPGNLRVGIPWDGLATPEQMTPVQKAETDFCVFVSPAWGFRALATDLRTKAARGLNTVREIITVYAPPNENDTPAYIRAVCDGVGIEPDAPLNLNDRAQLTAMCRAIAVREAGGWFFQTSGLELGIDLVLKPAIPSAHIA